MRNHHIREEAAQTRFLAVFEPVDELFKRVFVEARAPGEIEGRFGVAAFFAVSLFDMAAQAPRAFPAKRRTVQYDGGPARRTDPGPGGISGIVGRTDKTMRGIDQLAQTLHEVFEHGGYPNIRDRICQPSLRGAARTRRISYLW